MALKERINNDLKTALLGGNRFDAEVLRGLKAAILNEEVATGTREAGLADEAIERVIAREVKKRNESATIYRQNDRAEAADLELKEAAVLQNYLPQQLDESELAEIIDSTINEIGATGMQSMGMVMAAVKQKVGSTADGATISRIVKDKLPK